MIHTVTNSYFATGEGITHMVLFIKGSHDQAVLRFTAVFGDYYSQGYEITEGLRFDFNGANLLINDKLKAKLEDWDAQAGGLEYHAGVHVNFS
jgi:hypothetical protein